MHAIRAGLRFLRHHVEVLPGLALFFLLVAPYWFSLPVWDGQNFIACIKGAAHESFAWQYFLCYQHPTILFISLFAIPEYFFPGSVFLMHALMFALAAASIVAFSFLCRRFFPHASRSVRILSVLLFAAQPAIVSNAIDFNFDNGVTFFFVIVLALLLYGHDKWAAAVGLLMVFTKESGVLLYGLLLGGYWIFYIRTAHRFLPVALMAALRRWWLAIPIAFYILHIFWQQHVGNSVLHQDISPNVIFNSMLSFSFIHERFLTLMTEILLFQFMWFQSAIIVCAFLLWIWRRDIQGTKTQKFPHLGILVFLYLAGMYFLTRFVPWNNIRYMMPLFPLGILLFVTSCIALGRKTRITSALLSIAVGFNGIALFRSIDPISIALLATFPFGAHHMYALGNYDSCCLFGRDQLMYNMEYRKIFSLQDIAFQHIQPIPSTVIAFQRDAEDSHRALIDPITFRRTWSQSGFLPTYFVIDDILKANPLPKEFFFIDLPNLPAEEEKKRVEEKYAIATSEKISDGGYSIGLIKYVLKD